MGELDRAVASLIRITGELPTSYIASMDHSPSEQIDPNWEWYTSVVILSPGGEHSALADKIAESLHRKRLSKWKNAGKAYRQRFLKVLTDHLNDYPVIILSISATRTSIEDSFNHFIEQFKVSAGVKVTEANQKKYVTLSNLVEVETGKDIELQLPWGRGVMCFFIAHFILRMRHSIRNGRVESVDLHFYCDKFAGAEEMGAAVSLLLNRHPHEGRVNLAHFVESDTVSSDLLADNLAGCLSGLTKKEESQINSWHERIYWETWT